MSVSLYRKYRPQDFASVVGQTAAVSILTNALTKASAGHAYLFSGSRGCGKTSIARIFAKALNCLDPQGYEPCGKCRNCEAVSAGESLDVIEIDGASNNGVENIRNLRENISLAPFSSKHKVYIIDEVHMLSQGAFNALLKTLEEPPEYVVFIMATTEPYRVPVTIRSRCQHIPFRSISTEDISQRLEYVCRSEGVKADSEALYEISRQADGALRDGLSLLEQVISAGEITLANVEALLGAGSRSAFERVVSSFRTDPSEGYIALKAMFDGGASPVRVFEEMFSLVRNMWLISRWKGMIDALGLSKSERRFLNAEVPNWKPDSLHYLLDRTLKALTKARQGMRTDILLGSFMLSLAKPPASLSQQMPSVAGTSQATQQMPSVAGTSQATQQMPSVSGTPQAQPQPQAPAVNFDPALKAELLKTAHDGDFAVYCALFDVMPHAVDNTLMLDVEHAYCYDRLRLDENAVKLTEMFKSKYGQVILRYGNDKTVCPDPTDYRPKLPEEEQPVRRHKPAPASTQAPAPTQAPSPAQTPVSAQELSPAQSPVSAQELSPAQSPVSAQELSPAPAPETQQFHREISGIDTIRRDLAMMGTNIEVLMRIHAEHQDNDTNTDNDEGDPEE